MGRTGLLDKIHDSVSYIYRGREWLGTDGLEHEGRISFQDGLVLGLEAFREAQARANEDLHTLGGHIARIDNALKVSRINLMEKELLKQRQENMKAAQTVYLAMQKKILVNK